MNTATPGVLPLTVPERHLPAFETLQSIEEGDFAALLAAFATASADADRETMVHSVQQDRGLDHSDVRALLDAVMGLAALGYRTRSPANQVAMRVAASPQFIPSDDRHERFAHRIESLLKCEVIRIQSKALSLGAAHERVFVNAQIVTDLRPLFDNDIVENSEPEAALLTHTLSIHFVASDGKHDNIYVSLDDEDIELLQEALSRAVHKAASLKLILEDSGILFIESNE